MKVYAIPSDDSHYYACSINEALQVIKAELQEMEPGQEITIGIDEMTKAEYDALPEYNR